VSGLRAKLAARAELLGRVAEALDRMPQRWLADGPAIRYLESSRSLPPVVHAPVPLVDQVKLAHDQADRIVEVIDAVLDGLALNEGQYEQGRNLAATALRNAAAEGWEPL
jgi:hypothetical protein